jgi:hypothetical protein
VLDDTGEDVALRGSGRVAVMRILNIAVEQVGSSPDGRVIGRGRDIMTGWTISFVVPPADRDRILGEVRAGRRPAIGVPEVDALPWSSVSSVAWE